MQLNLFNYLIEYYKSNDTNTINKILEKYLGENSYDSSNDKIIKMLVEMKKSLFDSNIGSLNKIKLLSNMKFKRFYPTYD